jgi:transposase
MPLNEPSHLLYLFVLAVPSYRCRRHLSVALKTAQRTYTMFRHTIYDHTMAWFQEMVLAGEIEMDESMYGGHRKGKRGWGAAGKHIVFGLYQRNGQVMTFPVPDRKTNTLIHLVFQHTKPGSLYYSDDWHAYTWLSIKGDHVVVKKEKGMPKAKGRNHINGIEGFWSFSKNWLYHYRGIPQHHFHLYLKETEFRFNNRDEDLLLLISNLLTNILVPNMV